MQKVLKQLKKVFFYSLFFPEDNVTKLAESLKILSGFPLFI